MMRTFLGYVHGERGWIEGEEFHHAIRVDRLRIGDVFRLLDGQGGVFLARVREVDRRHRRAWVDILEEIPPPPPLPSIFLAVSLVRPERMRILVEKATEVGITRIRWLVFSRTRQRKLPKERLERVAWEAVKQCGRTTPPLIEGPQPLEKFIEEEKIPRVVLDPAGKPFPAWNLPEPPLWIVVGPEGGFTAQEKEQLAPHETLSLGNLTLRAETAAAVGGWGVIHQIQEKAVKKRCP